VMRPVAGAPFEAKNVYVWHGSGRGLSRRSKEWAERVDPGQDTQDFPIRLESLRSEIKVPNRMYFINTLL
ncbi:MAG: hypothetical protein WA146_10655, partial [Thiobacillus sp.]